MADGRLKVLVLNAVSASGLARLPAESYSTGADTNSIPVAAMNARGVPVFNAPGANANAVKELVLAGMLIAARNVAPALRFVAALDADAPDMEQAVESGKKAFAGYELAGQTLGVIGLGKIGCLVADPPIT